MSVFIVLQHALSNLRQLLQPPDALHARRITMLRMVVFHVIMPVIHVTTTEIPVDFHVVWGIICSLLLGRRKLDWELVPSVIQPTMYF